MLLRDRWLQRTAPVLLSFTQLRTNGPGLEMLVGRCIFALLVPARSAFVAFGSF